VKECLSQSPQSYGRRPLWPAEKWLEKCRTEHQGYWLRQPPFDPSLSIVYRRSSSETEIIPLGLAKLDGPCNPLFMSKAPEMVGPAQDRQADDAANEKRLAHDGDHFTKWSIFRDLLLFSWAVWRCRAQAAAGEHRHGDEGFGCVESVGAFGQCS